MVSSEEAVKSKAWNLLIRLFKEAKKDGCIDFDEGRILNSTDLNVNKLLSYMKEAWSDKKITATEQANIEFLVRKIEDDAVTLAEYDEIITDQELALLNIIRKLIDGFADESFDF